ncbi:MAG: Flp pilus assembly protein CpaB [Bacillota bacterium]
MNWKTWTPLILAALLGLVAAKVGRDLILHAQRASVPAAKFTNIVAAKADLPPGHPLAESDLILSATQADVAPRNAFHQTADLRGRVLLIPVVKGQPILETSLAPTGSGAGPQAMVPLGMRAIALEVNEASSLGGLLAPGCCVDVVSTLQDADIAQQVTRTIVENVKVLAVGQRLIASSRKDSEENTRAKTVSLLVTPRDAEAIELASNTGRIRLVLRGSLDRSQANASGITLAELLGGERNKSAALHQTRVPTTRPTTPLPTQVATMPKPALFRSIEVIRNGVATQVQVPASVISTPSAVTSSNSEVEPAFPSQSP